MHWYQTCTNKQSNEWVKLDSIIKETTSDLRLSDMCVGHRLGLSMLLHKFPVYYMNPVFFVKYLFSLSLWPDASCDNVTLLPTAESEGYEPNLNHALQGEMVKHIQFRQVINRFAPFSPLSKIILIITPMTKYFEEKRQKLTRSWRGVARQCSSAWRCALSAYNARRRKIEK